MSSHIGVGVGLTPKRSSPKKNTKSTPNLNSLYNKSALQSTAPPVPTTNNSGFDFGLSRQASLASLTSGSLAALPDATKRYPLSTVFDEQTPIIGNMPPFTPSRIGGAEDVEVGDLVDVPGNMYGTVKFVGTVQGKKGTFAGVELSEEFASKGKNNGDVDGISYFSTSIEGAGIFLPVARATRRSPPSSHEGSFSLTPSSPTMSNKTGGLDSTYYPPTPSVPKFSQSIGPGGRATSPFVKKTRPSAQRPESPVRRPATTRPSLSTPQPRIPSRYTSASPAPGNFGQSVRGTQDSRDPNKRVGYPSKNGMKPGVTSRSASALGGPGAGPMNLSDDDATPVRVARTITNGSISSVSSFSAKLRPASRAASRAGSRATDDELDRLRSQLEDRERQLRDQASSLADMENSLLEVQALMNSTDSDMNSNRQHRNSMDDKDATQLRMILREKNEKIAMLTAEFDAHRADFRSTIDTLELASTETERVYEKRVEDLLMELREMQERSEDVDSVARQLKQLEELVQELEEGLEDARRGEAEARGEVEFLRGEVERTRSELRREREKTAEAINNANANSNGDAAALTKELQQRDDEIRGLKAIIHSLSRDAIPDTNSSTPDMDKTPTHRPSLSRSQQTSASAISKDDNQAREKLEQEIRELRAMLESKENKEEQMERELEGLRRGTVSNHPPAQRTSALSTATITQDRDSYRDSKGTNGSWHDRERAPEPHRNTLESMPESDTYSSAAESFCELCETSGHDILTCTNMFGPGGHTRNASGPPQRTGKDVVMEVLKLSPKPLQQQDENVNKDTPAPLSPQKTPLLPQEKSSPVVETPPIKVIPNLMESGPAAGKESGVIDMDKWCGVCEREGHDSIDCPFEDAF